MDFKIFQVYVKRCEVQKEFPTWAGFLNFTLNLGELVTNNKMCAVEWIKLNLGMFDNAKLKIINSLKEKDVINYVWIRLLIQAGKINDSGKIYINKNLPYTLETLSIVVDRPLAEVRTAIEILKKLNMITINDNHIIKIKNWTKYQNVEGLEKSKEQSKLRMRKMRAKRKAEKESNSYVTVTDKKENEIKKKNLDKSIENKEKDSKDNIVTLEEKKTEKLNVEAMELLNYYEKLTGKVGVFKFESIVLAIDIYGECNVRKAIEKSIEVGKMNMRYVNGILKNWAKEGYPEEGGSLSGDSGFGKDGSAFKGVESKEPRELTNEERKNAKKLI